MYLFFFPKKIVRLFCLLPSTVGVSFCHCVALLHICWLGYITVGWDHMHGSASGLYTATAKSGWVVATNRVNLRKSICNNWLFGKGICDGIGLCTQGFIFVKIFYILHSYNINILLRVSSSTNKPCIIRDR